MEGKSIGEEQEACDGMANRVSALMFQTLGELVARLAVLRASVQPCTISSKHIDTKGCRAACRFAYTRSQNNTEERRTCRREDFLPDAMQQAPQTLC